MPLLRSISAKWSALLRRWMLCFRLPDHIYYINGPETLPPPLSREEEKLVFEGLAAGDPESRDLLIVHNLRLVVYIRSLQKYQAGHLCQPLH